MLSCEGEARLTLRACGTAGRSSLPKALMGQEVSSCGGWGISGWEWRRSGRGISVAAASILEINVLLETKSVSQTRAGIKSFSLGGGKDED